MMLRLAIKDDMTNQSLQMELAPETTIDEIIQASADHWTKPRGAYVLRWQNALLRGEMRLDEAGIATGESLTLMADPEGG